MAYAEGVSYAHRYRRRVFFVALLTLTTLMPFAIAQADASRLSQAYATMKAPHAQDQSRAMWVWTQPPAQELVSWAHTNNVGTIFLQVPSGLPTSPMLPWARSVAQAAHAQGIKVTALNGDVGWLAHPEVAVAWQRAAEATGLFDGIHIDVEPWSLVEWRTSAPHLVRQYLRLVKSMTSATELPVEADIAYWLNTVRTPGGVPMDAAVMRHVDAVTIMSYRNKVSGPDGILGVGASAIRTAHRTHTRYRLAVETLYYGTDPESKKQTFDGLGRRVMQSVMDGVDRLQTGDPAYNGIAVHHYDSWRALRY
jgi:hypothetical protein